MNVNATEIELADIAETLKLAAILDDRAPRADKARIIAWAEQIHRHKLVRDDLLNGLQAFYDGPSERAIQIGDLIQHARQARRTRVMAEEDDERAARQELYDRKAADDMFELSASFIAGRVSDTPRLKAAREALDDCSGKAESKAAIAEFFAAKAEARRRKTGVAQGVST